MKRLEYIQSTGSQFIDTGEVARPTLRIDTDFQFTATSTRQQRVFGRTSDNGSATSLDFDFYINGSGKWAWACQDKTGNWQTTNITVDTNRHKIILDSYNNHVKFDESYQATITTARSIIDTKNIYIFASNVNSAGVSRYATLKLYNLIMYDNDTLIHYFIPVEDDDGIACMLDLVSGNYFYNQGTGTFTKGPRIPQYTEIEYLENSGTQYIDTGFIPNYDTKFRFEIEYAPTILGKRYCLISNYNTTKHISCEISAANQSRYYLNNGALDNKILSPLVNTTKNTSIYEWNEGTWYHYCNEGTATNTLSLSGVSGGSCYIFVDRSKRYSTFGNPLKIFSCKIYENEELIRDFIPVLDKDDIPCLYDKVNDTYYYNQGTGDFIGGDIVPRAFADTTGLQQIANNIKAALNTKQDELTAGNDITIAQDGTIAVDTVAITNSEIDACFE